MKGKKTMSKQILRVAKLKTFGEVGKSAAHTFREIKTANANPANASKNAHSVADGAAVSQGVKNRLAGLKVRKNAVLALEFLVTASHDFFDKRSGQSYFDDAKRWLERSFGPENVISSHIHRDETTPHAVFYVVPVDKNGKLNARAFIGGVAKLSKMQDSFHSSVAKKYKLERGVKGSKATHTTIKDYYARATAKAPKPPTRGNLILMSNEERFETMKTLHAQATHARAMVEVLEDERARFTARIEHLESAAVRNKENEDLIRKAMARSIKNSFTPAQFAKEFGVELKGKADVFDALIKTGQAVDFAQAVAKVALAMPSPYASSWEELAEWTVDYDKAEPVKSQTPSITPAAKPKPR
jgi:hypothetical protein